MKLHANARTCPNSRRLIVRRVDDEGCERTARKWISRFQAEGEPGLCDRSSRPERSPERIPAAEIAECLSMALSTVSR